MIDLLSKETNFCLSFDDVERLFKLVVKDLQNLNLNAESGSWLSGAADPEQSEGITGNWYMQTTTWHVWRKTTTWQDLGTIKGDQGDPGDPGTDGDSAFVYIAYASADDGTDFSLVFSPSLNYIAVKTTTEAIASPQVTDFTGLWFNYKGAKGEQGDSGDPGLPGTNGEDGDSAYVYIAYASDVSGTNFTTTFNVALNYIAVKATTVAIASPQASDFTGLWFNYKGAKGDEGDPGTAGADGKTWLSGTSDPTTEGVNGDFYLQRTSWHVWEKVAGTWEDRGTIKGADGEDGEDGTGGGSPLVPQMFSSLGDGSDGAFVSSGNANLACTEYTYTDFNLQAGHKLTLPSGNPFVIIRCTGTCTIAGIISAVGSVLLGNAGTGGGSGGGGGTYSTPAGAAGKGIEIAGVVVVAGGAGATAENGFAGSSPSAALQKALLSLGIPLWGASGGTGFQGISGGRGGGCVIVVANEIVFTGTISVAGQKGGDDTNDGGGGGGGGGVIIMAANTWTTNTGTRTVSGGVGGNGDGDGGAGGAGWYKTYTLT